jgi:LuxR family maltose regulon positive regulatory protein
MAQARPTVRGEALVLAGDAAGRTLLVGSPAWYAWLADAASFSFSGDGGHFTARRERAGSGRGGWYWKAYRRRGGALHRAYLGKAEELTLERLRAAAAALGPADPSRREPDRDPLPAPAAGPLARSGSEPAADPLLRSKLHAPPARPDLVPRPRLLDRLAAGLRGPLTLVAAPAGAGKTSLLAAWRAAPLGGGVPLAWVSLDAGDNDPARFWRYVAAALDQLQPGVADGAMALLCSPQPPPVETVLTVLLNALAALPRDAVLALDDYHAIEAPEIHRGLAFLLDHLPPRLHLVVASRADPPLPLGRLRARGALAEIRAADLRFTEAEAAAFLGGAMGLELTAEQVAALAARTEGWIAGLQLAALSLQGRGDASDFIRDFAGSHRFLVDYLADEVLERQPAAVQRFLLETAVLDRLSGPLCDALTGRDDGAALLGRLERANLFTVPLDDEGRWYRYHHLFADVLRRRLAEDAPTSIAVLYERACLWHERHGDAATAFDYALRGGHAGHAARVLDAMATALIANSETDRFLRLVAPIPADLRAAHARLALAEAWALVFTDRPEAAEAAVATAEAHLAHPERLPADLPAPRLVATIATLRAYVATRAGDLAGTVRHSSAALAALDAAEVAPAGAGVAGYPRGALLLNLGIARQRLADDVGGAEQAYLAALPLNHAANRPFATIATYGHLMALCRARGQFDRAVALGREGLAWIERQGGALFPVEHELHLTLIEIAYERDDLAGAAAHERRVAELRALMARGPGARLTDRAVGAYLPRFLAAHARGEHEAALGHLRELEGAVLRQEVRSPSLGAAVLARMRLQLWRARPEDARLLAELRRWATECGLGADDAFAYPEEPAYAALAPVLLALGERGHDAALALAGRLCGVAERAGRFGDLLGYQVPHALALDALGRRGAAVAAIRRALELAEPLGAARSLLDAGAPARTLLRVAPATPYRDRLLRASGDAPAPAAAGTTLVEPLSAREREVLGLMAAGLSNPEIAARLYVGVGTVKTHVHRVLAKLAAGSRTQAVARARGLGLLAD